MGWSSVNRLQSTPVPVFVRIPRPGGREGTVALERGRVLQTPVCLKSSSGLREWESLGDCWRSIGKGIFLEFPSYHERSSTRNGFKMDFWFVGRRRKSTVICTNNCTWRLRVMYLRTSESLWSSSTRRRPRTRVRRCLSKISDFFLTSTCWFMQDWVELDC